MPEEKDIDTLGVELDRKAAQEKSERSMSRLNRGRPTGEGDDDVTYCSVPGCNARAFEGYCARHSAERRAYIRRAHEDTAKKYGLKRKS